MLANVFDNKALLDNKVPHTQINLYTLIHYAKLTTNALKFN